MPYLRPEDRRQLLCVLGPCKHCEQDRVRNYCRECDVFFDSCGCIDPPGPHDEHRVYLHGEPPDTVTRLLDSLGV